jgi:hypothetical protein
MRNFCISLVIVTWFSFACAQAESPLIHSVITASSNGWTKICYVGSVQCSGGVGSHAPLGTPAMSFGLNSPNASTGTSNAVAHFQMVDANQDVYTEVLYVNTVGKADGAFFFTRDFSEKFMPPPGTTNLEWDVYQFEQPNGLDTMLGTQCNGRNHRIQYDNHGHGWVDTRVSCATMMDGNWHHVHQTFHRDVASSTACSGAPCEHWDTIQIDDGPVSDLNATLPMTLTRWHAFGAQWQIDGRPLSASKARPAVYDLYVDSDTIAASVSR